MDARPLSFIAKACAGELSAGAPMTLAIRICTDSRQAQGGDVFFALPGERFDGHDFLREVAKKGVVAVVVEKGRASGDLRHCAVIEVDHTRKALGRLAAEYRKEFTLPVVAVCGSNGKTTTKELVASVLRQRLATVWSDASFNNDIGVPLTLLKLERKSAAAVLEAGTNHPGELAPLIGMISPRFGVLTSIGREHLEFFGNLEGVALEEGALADLLPAEGKLFINGDGDWAPRIAERARAAVVTVGFGEQNLWRAKVSRMDKAGTSFRVEGGVAGFAGEYKMGLLGRHQVINALLAVAVGAELGLSPGEVQRGLAECEPAKMRLQLWEHNGVRVLDDAYNANADSMLAALETLKELPCKGRRVAVLGDMAELGPHSEAAHMEVGRRTAELGIGQLFAVGKMAPAMARGARAAGLTRVIEFTEVESAAAAVKQFARSGDLLLLKASRATRLERVSERLRAGENAKRMECSII
jgi:UDP-N-acetylmuramoyl-tripeptide--D-alanyl-D-alanine ligase